MITAFTLHAGSRTLEELFLLRDSCARVQVDPRAITADAVDAYRVAVFRVNGVR